MTEAMYDLIYLITNVVDIIFKVMIVLVIYPLRRAIYESK
tara:strand:+ start:933 stop:1052 length:120 start_codon:yes stop_codon:yes gene_type:complete